MARPRIDPKRRKAGKWFKLERLVGKKQEFVQNVEGYDFSVRESIEGVLVVQTPRQLAQHPEHLVRVQQKIGAMLEEAGVSMPLLMIPDDIEFARFREVPKKEAIELERRCFQPGYKVSKLTNKTPTEGSA